jgi:acyl carrier protein
MTEIGNEIDSIIVKRTKVDPSLLTSNAQLSDLGIDSLDLIEVVFDLEDKFGIEIPFNANSVSAMSDSASLQTLGDVHDTVRKLVEDKGGWSPVTA